MSQKLLESQSKPKRRPRGVDSSTQSEISYRAQLRRIITEIRKDINSTLLPELRKQQANFADGYIADNFFSFIQSIIERNRRRWTGPEFESLATQLAGDFIRQTNEINGRRIQEDLRGFGINFIDPDVRDYLDIAIQDNVRLIQSIPDRYLSQVEQIVATNVRSGNRAAVIQRALSAQFGAAQKRAALIARDQTAKINGDLSARRQRAAGFTHFRWVTSRDQRVRNRHDSLANRNTKYGKGIYRFDSPPLSDSGQPILPGQDYQCRCIAQPVLPSEINK